MIMDNLEASVANFVQKSFEIISNQQNSNTIQWLSSGKQFIIKDTDLFESVVLPNYFRHRNINSFIRQLNMYGFHKSRKQPTKNIFSHPNFVQGRPELLVNVRRKLKEQKSDDNSSTVVVVSKPKQDIISSNAIVEQTKQQKIQPFQSKQAFRSRQNLQTNFEKRQKELQKTAIKQQYLVSLCSMENMDDFGNQFNQKSIDWPFRSLIEKSQIMQLNPEVYTIQFQNLTSLNHIDEVQFDFSSGNQKIMKNQSLHQIQNERKMFNNRMIGYNILQTINFMNELNL